MLRSQPVRVRTTSEATTGSELDDCDQASKRKSANMLLRQTVLWIAMLACTGLASCSAAKHPDPLKCGRGRQPSNGRCVLDEVVDYGDCVDRNKGSQSIVDNGITLSEKVTVLGVESETGAEFRNRVDDLTTRLSDPVALANLANCKSLLPATVPPMPSSSNAKTPEEANCDKGELESCEAALEIARTDADKEAKARPGPINNCIIWLDRRAVCLEQKVQSRTAIRRLCAESSSGPECLAARQDWLTLLSSCRTPPPPCDPLPPS